MVSVRGRFEYPDGLTPGQSKEGGLHHNLYDAQGNLVGHGTFVPDEEGDEAPADTPPPLFFGPDECSCEQDTRSRERVDPEEVAAALILLIRGAAWAAPRVRRWWQEHLLPAARTTRARLSRSRGQGGDAGDSGDAVEVDQGGVSGEEDRSSMSGEEASARLAAALMARLFSDEQMEILRRARIAGADGSSDPSAVEQAVFQQVVHEFTAMVEANPALFGKGSLAELGKGVAMLRADGGTGMRAIEG
ncbi:hypothetical protein ACFUJY_24950 [Streptomyces sp. NPDC057249]|uniref:hypothetical protein n=1 Tax=Streptomyces sp. NPDC057249 TaxID=3346067 RepID=UPI003637AA23